MLGVDFNVDKRLREETGGVSVEEVFNSYNLAESPRPASNIKAHVWSPTTTFQRKNQQSRILRDYNKYSNEISKRCKIFSGRPSREDLSSESNVFFLRALPKLPKYI